MQGRYLSVDVFRGITIALMVFVDTPGHLNSYAWAQHADWDGCQLADLVFPFFIFVMGLSVVLSHASRPPSIALWLKIFKRALLLFLIGLFLNAFPFHSSLEHLRLLGVLQRIAFCYLAAAVCVLTLRWQTQLMLFVGLLVFYWSLFAGVDVKSLLWTPEGNLVAAFDKRFIGEAHLYRPWFDPEGLLSTLPAIATVLMGNLTGYALKGMAIPSTKARAFFIVGLLSLGLGAGIDGSFPINKALWTSAFVLWTGGMALILYSVCYYLIEIKGIQRVFMPFKVFGVNAIAAYVLHVMCYKLQVLTVIHTASGEQKLRQWLFNLFFPWTSVQMGSLLYALCNVILCWLAMYWLYRKRVLIKI